MCSSLMPRLRAASSVRSSSALPTPWLCHGFSIENAASASCANSLPSGRSSATPRNIAVDEEAVHHGIEPARELGVVHDELVRHRAAETVAPALRVETQQVIAIRAGAVDPDLADHAVDQGLVHRVSVLSSRAAARPSGMLAFRQPR